MEQQVLCSYFGLGILPSVLILLFGAQVTFTYSKEMGRIILPTEEAVAVTITEVEREEGMPD